MCQEFPRAEVLSQKCGKKHSALGLPPGWQTLRWRPKALNRRERGETPQSSRRNTPGLEGNPAEDLLCALCGISLRTLRLRALVPRPRTRADVLRQKRGKKHPALALPPDRQTLSCGPKALNRRDRGENRRVREETHPGSRTTCPGSSLRALRGFFANSAVKGFPFRRCDDDQLWKGCVLRLPPQRRLRQPVGLCITFPRHMRNGEFQRARQLLAGPVQ